MREVLMSPAMFRNLTIDGPMNSKAVADAVDKVTVNFVRSLSSGGAGTNSKTVKEGLGQLESGFTAALRNNLVRLYGKPHYNESERELDEQFYDLVVDCSKDAIEMALSTIDRSLKQFSISDSIVNDNERASDLIVDALDNAWNVCHSMFKKAYNEKFARAA